ncbi:hypothetical protein Patl1_00254 [Pistacia atlantica]|uniref:Uncharacterized protein n=1 Tax=Pistacia atlantica TaxID=434234 RepID=A0ACC1C6E6_9ROSI|nr:hypothetical protein Patl1_00254 [Pistacia atlantica]
MISFACGIGLGLASRDGLFAIPRNVALCNEGARVKTISEVVKPSSSWRSHNITEGDRPMWSCVNNNIFSSIRNSTLLPSFIFSLLLLLPSLCSPPLVPYLSWTVLITPHPSLLSLIPVGVHLIYAIDGGRVGGRGKGLENDRERSRGRRGGGSSSGGKDKIDALGRLM